MHTCTYMYIYTHTWRTHMGMEGYFSLSEAQMTLLAARSAAVRGESSDLALTAQFFF